ncbi:hypothetical protein [Chitiniphilus shinanonensis]|uniref:hypothetical protein n=1 Tax=Chitiniphilus shinanonensis TaxID=553088 RepID=UPI003341617F
MKKKLFRVSQWLDTSDDEAEQFPIVYGIQRNVGSRWVHCCEGSEPLFFETLDAASAKCDALNASTLT